MKRTPVLLLTLIVALPLVLLTWVGSRLARNEKAMLQERMRDLATDRLRDIDRLITTHLDALRRDLHRQTDVDNYDANELRRFIRDDARVLQLFVIRPDGGLLYPDPLGSLNRTEREFLTRASQIVTDRELQRVAESQSDVAPIDEQTSSIEMGGSVTGHKLQSPGQLSGWFEWYWGRGLNLLYWQRRQTGHIVGVALDRSRWISDLIAALPDTPGDAPHSTPDSSLSRIRLVDSSSRPIYQWGRFEVPEPMTPVCEIPLSPPLSAWRLQQFVPTERLASGPGYGMFFNLGTGLTVAAAGLVALAFFLYREYARDMREAVRRVSFVNQVSHELRTPLTNIRMYSDLLESDLAKLTDEAAEQPRKRLNVIQSESQRLSRLIGNVLTFARQQRKTLRLNLSACSVDQIVSDVIERFGPSLKQLGIRIEFDGQAGRPVLVDQDALEQVLGNLISNVEKYAAGGRRMEIATRRVDDRTFITVADCGPGVAPLSREKVFQPFWRGSDALNDTAGTGIGLTIARELARLHGGDVTLIDSQQGACFQIELATSLAGSDGAR